MEIIWTKIFDNEKLELYHSFFKKMEIIKVIELNDINQQFFAGCYILNLKYDDLGEVSKYHFYTTNFFLDDGIKRMCIQPYSMLDQNYQKDNDEDINQRIITWFKNGQQIFKYGIDVLGQEHGNLIDKNYKNLQNGIDSDEAKKITKDNDFKKENIKSRFENAYQAILIAIILNQNEVINKIINSEKVSIFDIFS